MKFVFNAKLIMKLWGFLLIFAFVPSWTFKLGHEYTYQFTNIVNISDSSSSEPLTYKLEGSFNLATVWRNADDRLVQFRVISSKLEVKSQKSNEFVEKKNAYEISPAPFFANFKENALKSLYLEENEDTKVVNLKRAIVSFFQFEMKDATTTETDVTGTCDVSYIAWSATKITKSKMHCKLHDVFSNKRKNHPLGVGDDITNRIDYEFETDGVAQTIDSEETFKFQPNAYANVVIVVNSTFNIEVNPAIGTIESMKCQTLDECLGLLTKVKEVDVISEVKPRCADGSCFNLVKQIRDAKEFLDESVLGKSDSAATIATLVQAGRQAKLEEWTRILNSRTGKENLSQLLDLLAAVQTKEAFMAVKETLDFEKEENFNNLERFFQSLAIGINPHDEVLQALLKIATTGKYFPKLEDTLTQTITSMGRNLAELLDGDYKDQLVSSVLTFLKEKLETKCTTDDCKSIYIRSLGNLRAPNTIPLLLTYAHGKSNKLAVDAMKALKTFPTAYFNTDEMQNNLEEIFFQIKKPYDSSARTLALDILLQLKISPTQLTRLVKYLSVNDTAFEVKQYLLQKLQINMAKCSFWRKAIKEIIKNDSRLNNYNVLGQKGLSTAILRDFAAYPSFNGSLLSIQEIKDGVLKRGTADIFVEANGEKFSIFTLGLFTNGLSSFVGGTDDDDASPTAGMELTLQGTAMRPLIFFSSQGELMGHVWSGTASEPTAAYQGVTLLQDHEEYIRLQNGIHLEVSALGAISVDLKGQISMSLWNRNAVSKVFQNLGIATVMKVDVNGFAHLSMDFEVTEEPSLHMLSNIDFSDKIALCIQLTQPKNELRHFITKHIQIPKDNFKSSSTVSRSFFISGLTHVLNKKNNDMCKIILT